MPFTTPYSPESPPYSSSLANERIKVNNHMIEYYNTRINEENDSILEHFKHLKECLENSLSSQAVEFWELIISDCNKKITFHKRNIMEKQYENFKINEELKQL